MIIQIISIILSSILSLIAVGVSIISIKKQTRSQNINASIQLFDKRFEIYNFIVDLWYIVGYFEGCQDLYKNTKKSYQNIIKYIKENNLTKDISKKVEYAYLNSKKYLRMHPCLFSGKVSDYLEKLLSNFTIYIYGIYHKTSLDKNLEEQAYQELFSLYETEDIDLKELRKYIDLSDIKRLDI